ncbi:uncharacterized protein LOC129595291 [Paramacrobiotus metropolitanus]|uniref:uncharacterized protein LOC129595291 n=1 Tax=Paramacrobiotus metropolitanus TaxID=2943436 RepID=UPI00244609E4|nr:uncharacterized protein LOC129595291 [Paramacrobiotus metropolitanus]
MADMNVSKEFFECAVLPPNLRKPLHVMNEYLAAEYVCSWAEPLLQRGSKLVDTVFQCCGLPALIGKKGDWGPCESIPCTVKSAMRTEGFHLLLHADERRTGNYKYWLECTFCRDKPIYNEIGNHMLQKHPNATYIQCEKCFAPLSGPISLSVSHAVVCPRRRCPLAFHIAAGEGRDPYVPLRQEIPHFPFPVSKNKQRFVVERPHGRNWIVLSLERK